MSTRHLASVNLVFSSNSQRARSSGCTGPVYGLSVAAMPTSTAISDGQLPLRLASIRCGLCGGGTRPRSCPRQQPPRRRRAISGKSQMARAPYGAWRPKLNGLAQDKYNAAVNLPLAVLRQRAQRCDHGAEQFLGDTDESADGPQY